MIIVIIFDIKKRISTNKQNENFVRLISWQRSLLRFLRLVLWSCFRFDYGRASDTSRKRESKIK